MFDLLIYLVGGENSCLVGTHCFVSSLSFRLSSVIASARHVSCGIRRPGLLHCCVLVGSFVSRCAAM